MGARIIHKNCHLKGCLFGLGLVHNPICKRYLNKDGAASQILCEYEAVTNLRFDTLNFSL
jgi:hypothetical protein